MLAFSKTYRSTADHLCHFFCLYLSLFLLKSYVSLSIDITIVHVDLGSKLLFWAVKTLKRHLFLFMYIKKSGPIVAERNIHSQIQLSKNLYFMLSLF